MGWSCTAKAGHVLQAWSAACIKSTDTQNNFKANGETYFYETSRKEHDDGAITGTIWKFLPTGHCRRSGSFRIEGDGTVTKAPKFLKHNSPTAHQIEQWYQETYVMPYCQTRALADSLR